MPINVQRLSLEVNGIQPNDVVARAGILVRGKLNMKNDVGLKYVKIMIIPTRAPILICPDKC
jgi:hypothetical protein